MDTIRVKNAKTGQWDQIEVIDILQIHHTEGRIISVGLDAEEKHFLSLHNPEESGRINFNVRLSKDTMDAIFVIINLYMMSKGMDYEKMLKENFGPEIDYYCSDNIKIPGS